MGQQESVPAKEEKEPKRNDAFSKLKVKQEPRDEQCETPRGDKQWKATVASAASRLRIKKEPFSEGYDDDQPYLMAGAKIKKEPPDLDLEQVHLFGRAALPEISDESEEEDFDAPLRPNPPPAHIAATSVVPQSTAWAANTGQPPPHKASPVLSALLNDNLHPSSSTSSTVTSFISNHSVPPRIPPQSSIFPSTSVDEQNAVRAAEAERMRKQEEEKKKKEEEKEKERKKRELEQMAKEAEASLDRMDRMMKQERKEKEEEEKKKREEEENKRKEEEDKRKMMREQEEVKKMMEEMERKKKEEEERRKNEEEEERRKKEEERVRKEKEEEGRRLREVEKKREEEANKRRVEEEKKRKEEEERKKTEEEEKKRKEEEEKKRKEEIEAERMKRLVRDAQMAVGQLEGVDLPQTSIDSGRKDVEDAEKRQREEKERKESVEGEGRRSEETDSTPTLNNKQIAQRLRRDRELKEKQEAWERRKVLKSGTSSEEAVRAKREQKEKFQQEQQKKAEERRKKEQEISDKRWEETKAREAGDLAFELELKEERAKARQLKKEKEEEKRIRKEKEEKERSQEKEAGQSNAKEPASIEDMDAAQALARLLKEGGDMIPREEALRLFQRIVPIATTAVESTERLEEDTVVKEKKTDTASKDRSDEPPKKKSKGLEEPSTSKETPKRKRGRPPKSAHKADSAHKSTEPVQKKKRDIITSSSDEESEDSRSKSSSAAVSRKSSTASSTTTPLPAAAAAAVGRGLSRSSETPPPAAATVAAAAAATVKKAPASTHLPPLAVPTPLQPKVAGQRSKPGHHLPSSMDKKGGVEYAGKGAPPMSAMGKIPKKTNGDANKGMERISMIPRPPLNSFTSSSSSSTPLPPSSHALPSPPPRPVVAARVAAPVAAPARAAAAAAPISAASVRKSSEGGEMRSTVPQPRDKLKNPLGETNDLDANIKKIEEEHRKKIAAEKSSRVEGVQPQNGVAAPAATAAEGKGTTSGPTSGVNSRVGPSLTAPTNVSYNPFHPEYGRLRTGSTESRSPSLASGSPTDSPLYSSPRNDGVNRLPYSIPPPPVPPIIPPPTAAANAASDLSRPSALQLDKQQKHKSSEKAAAAAASVAASISISTESEGSRSPFEFASPRSERPLPPRSRYRTDSSCSSSSADAADAAASKASKEAAAAAIPSPTAAAAASRPSPTAAPAASRPSPTAAPAASRPSPTTISAARPSPTVAAAEIRPSPAAARPQAVAAIPSPIRTSATSRPSPTAVSPASNRPPIAAAASRLSPAAAAAASPTTCAAAASPVPPPNIPQSSPSSIDTPSSSSHATQLKSTFKMSRRDPRIAARHPEIAAAAAAVTAERLPQKRVVQQAPPPTRIAPSTVPRAPPPAPTVARATVPPPSPTVPPPALLVPSISQSINDPNRLMEAARHMIDRELEKTVYPLPPNGPPVPPPRPPPPGPSSIEVIELSSDEEEPTREEEVERGEEMEEDDEPNVDPRLRGAADALSWRHLKRHVGVWERETNRRLREDNRKKEKGEYKLIVVDREGRNSRTRLAAYKRSFIGYHELNAQRECNFTTQHECDRLECESDAYKKAADLIQGRRPPMEIPTRRESPPPIERPLEKTALSVHTTRVKPEVAETQDPFVLLSRRGSYEEDGESARPAVMLPGFDDGVMPIERIEEEEDIYRQGASHPMEEEERGEEDIREEEREETIEEENGMEDVDEEEEYERKEGDRKSEEDVIKKLMYDEDEMEKEEEEEDKEEEVEIFKELEEERRKYKDTTETDEEIEAENFGELDLEEVDEVCDRLDELPHRISPEMDRLISGEMQATMRLYKERKEEEDWKTPLLKHIVQRENDVIRMLMDAEKPLMSDVEESASVFEEEEDEEEEEGNERGEGGEEEEETSVENGTHLPTTSRNGTPSRSSNRYGGSRIRAKQNGPMRREVDGDAKRRQSTKSNHETCSTIVKKSPLISHANRATSSISRDSPTSSTSVHRATASTSIDKSISRDSSASRSSSNQTSAAQPPPTALPPTASPTLPPTGISDRPTSRSSNEENHAQSSGKEKRDREERDEFMFLNTCAAITRNIATVNQRHIIPPSAPLPVSPNLSTSPIAKPYQSSQSTVFPNPLYPATTQQYSPTASPSTSATTVLPPYPPQFVTAPPPPHPIPAPPPPPPPPISLIPPPPIPPTTESMREDANKNKGKFTVSNWTSVEQATVEESTTEQPSTSKETEAGLSNTEDENIKREKNVKEREARGYRLNPPFDRDPDWPATTFDEDRRTLCVTKVTAQMTVEELKEHFQKFGAVEEVLIREPFRFHKTSHLAFIRYVQYDEDQLEEARAVEINVQKRILSVFPYLRPRATPPPDSP